MLCAANCCCKLLTMNVLPERQVTRYSGHMGDTLPLQRRGHALEGVSRHGRAASVCGPPARGREDGAVVRRVRDLTEDWLQDLRPLQRLRGPSLHGSQSAALSPGQSTAAAAGSGDCAVEARIPRVGGAEDPRKAA